MQTNKNLYNSLFIVNYISSTLFSIFTIWLGVVFDKPWAISFVYSDNSGIDLGTKITFAFYLSLIATITFISLTILFYRKIKSLNKNN